MDDFTVIVGTAPTLAFEKPLEVVRAENGAGLSAALDRCEAALGAGAWIAGYVGYSGDAAIGIFGRPQTTNLPD